MNLRLCWRQVATAFVLTTAIIAGLWSRIEPVYFTNDDVGFRLAITGEDVPGGPPSSHLLTTHAALTTMAVEVQKALPDVSVWDWILSATLVAGVAGLYAFVWCIVGPARGLRYAALVVLTVTVVPFIAGLQFTISAIVCGGAAALIAIGELAHPSRPRGSIIAAALALLVVGFLVRPMGAEAGALVTTVLLGLPAASSAARRVRLTRLGLAAAVLVALFGALNVADGMFYGSRGGWADYSRYHWRIVDLIDWGGGDDTGQVEAVRAATGWTENDWNLLRSRWGIDATVFGFTQMARATEAAVRAGASTSTLGRLTTRIGSGGIRVAADLLPELALVAVLALMVAACFGSTRALVLTCGILLMFLALCVGIQAISKELPFRVLAPLQTCLMAVVLATIAEHPRVASRWRVTVALAVGLAMLVQQGRLVAVQAVAEEDQARSIEQQVSEVLALEPSLLVLHSDAFVYESWWRPFHRPGVTLPIIATGWNNQDPRLQNYLVATGRAPLFRAICSDPSILVVANPGRLDVVTRSLAEHDGLDVTWTPVFLGTIRVWRCTPSTG
jgi:hypothetical protein